MILKLSVWTDEQDMKVFSRVLGFKYMVDLDNCNNNVIGMILVQATLAFMTPDIFAGM